MADMNKENGKNKILIVDDDPVIIRLLEGILTENNYDAVSSIEASDGLQMAIDQKPDLILLDVMMPIINGYNFCKLLKEQEAHKHIPIIFITSRDAKEDIKIGQEMGANAYLTKPVDRKELLAKISELIKK